MSAFFDTNVLVYAMDAGDPLRQNIAIERFARAVREDGVVLSTQVPPLSVAEAARQLTQLSAFEVVGASAQSVLAATELVRKHCLQWWNAFILEAALRANADVRVTEDGRHGRRFGSLIIENPFRGAA